jgi:DNA-directed RNA polymerase specialized sigma24 family protein
MLGSTTEADDAVQETWLRFSRSDTSAVENLASWLTTVVSRVCLNMLQARRGQSSCRHCHPYGPALLRGRADYDMTGMVGWRHSRTLLASTQRAHRAV